MIVHIPRTGEVGQFILLSPQLVGNTGVPRVRFDLPPDAVDMKKTYKSWKDWKAT